MALLNVNLDQIASIRELRHLKEPDPAQAAVLAEVAGADGISVHLRRERRPVRERDLYILRELVKTRLNVMMSPVEELIERIEEVKPQMVTFVADAADSEAPAAAIDFGTVSVDFSDLAARLGGIGIAVSYFIEPNDESVKGASRAGASAIMLSCEGYVVARTEAEAGQELDNLDRTAQAARKAGLEVHAGRGLNYKNVAPLVELGLIDQFVIGQAIIARSLMVGMDRAVGDMLALVRHEIRE